jgi:small subunit ribosomal protein S15
MPKRDHKKTVISGNQAHAKDTGSIPVQIALLSTKISSLTEHLQLHPKDVHSRRGLLSAVGRRRKLLAHLKDKSKEGYETLISRLGLRH